MNTKEKNDELLSLEDMLLSVQEKLQELDSPKVKVEDEKGEKQISREAVNEITRQLTGQLLIEEMEKESISPEEAKRKSQEKLNAFLKETETDDIEEESDKLSKILMDTPEQIQRTRTRLFDTTKLQENSYEGISERELLEYHEFKKNRMQKARDFVLRGYHTHTLHTAPIPPLYDEQTQEALSEQIENNAESEIELDEHIDTMERRTKEDDAAIEDYLAKFKKSSFISACIVGALGIITGIFQIISAASISINNVGFLSLGINFIAILAAGFVSKDVIITGLKSLIYLKANRDSLPSLAMVGSLIQIVFLFFSALIYSSDTNLFILAPVAILSMAFHHGAKYLLAVRCIHNLQTISSRKEMYGSDIVESEELAADLTKGTIYKKPFVAYNRKTSFITNFVYHSFLDDMSDRISFFLAPAAALTSLVLFFITICVSGSVFESATILSACLCLFAPFGLMLSIQAPLYSLSKENDESSSAILGFSAAEEFSQLNATLTTAHDLFPKGSVVLRGMRAFGHHPIDHSILTAASMLYATNSILRDMFMQVLLNRTDILRPVDSVLLEDGLGISGWVDNRHVIIGNREMVINHNIEVPPAEEEKRLCPEGHKIVYLCISGELTAAFVFALSADERIANSLASLSEQEISLVVQTVDPAISSKTLAEVFGLDEQEIKILPARFNATYRKQTKETKTLSSAVVNDGSFTAYAKGLLTAKSLAMNFFISSIALLASVVAGVLLLAIFTSMGHIERISIFFILIYQLIWFGITMAIPYSRSKY